MRDVPHDRMGGSGDPGWPRLTPGLVVGIALSMVPLVGQRLALRGGEHGLLVLRRIFLQFVAALVLFGVVITVLAPGESVSRTSQLLAAAGLAVMGLATLAASESFARRAVHNFPDDVSLAARYRTLFFLRIALADATALFGFVLSIMSGAWWLYLVGAAFAFVGFARLAPTVSNLERFQLHLREAGCQRSLVDALAGYEGDAGRAGDAGV